VVSEEEDMVVLAVVMEVNKDIFSQVQVQIHTFKILEISILGYGGGYGGYGRGFGGGYGKI
jgi:hypothetical protein